MYNCPNMSQEKQRLTREEVLHIARLARLGLSEEDVARFQEQLSKLLEHFQVLQQVDTAAVPPTAHAIPLQNVMRPDVVSPSLSQEEVLSNAPRREGDFFRVRAVLEE
ncbi:MAG: Asp-tRNA(Asn)/Glu-tRNA(Gln) amidotransferase subunit GatC [Chloroflexota bacterium]|nr:Asp-tRNA(Asn)/Glu-tRNA(Gln) amidotransferase subunit GatC [Chloroflexota bacterium]